MGVVWAWPMQGCSETPCKCTSLDHSTGIVLAIIPDGTIIAILGQTRHHAWLLGTEFVPAVAINLLTSIAMIYSV